MYLNSVTIVGFVGADPEQRQARKQRREIHRSFGRHTAVLEERAGRVVLEDRVAPRLHLPPATRRIRPAVRQERLARPDRRQPDQLDLREAERQRQESDNREDHVVVDSRRCRAKARPRRTRTGSDHFHFACSRTKLPKQRSTLPSRTAMHRAPAICRGLFLCWPRLRPNPNKSSALPAQHSSIRPLHAVRFSDHACEGFGPARRTSGHDSRKRQASSPGRRETRTMSEN